MENLKITNQNVDSVLGIKDVSSPDANTDIRGKALSAIKVKEGEMETY